jgi:SAM-dependent methyltransferase
MPKRYTASTADKYELYQLSVQSAEEDIDFLIDTYRGERKKRPRHFREDFSGTCLLTATWVDRKKSHTAEAYDIDPEPLDWGRKRNIEPLGKAAKRAKQFVADVREPSACPPDVRCAQNFSYWIFKTRTEMLDYFRKARKDLAPGGIFVIDLHGGPECQQIMEEETEMEDEGFTYVWDQDSFEPISCEAHLFIHFRFADGTEMKNAFQYDWRIWGLRELRELLYDAGFPTVDCYWEGTDEDGESGNGIFLKEEEGDECDSYVAYLVALK